MHGELPTEALVICLVYISEYVLKLINFFWIYSTCSSTEERKIGEGETEEGGKEWLGGRGGGREGLNKHGAISSINTNQIWNPLKKIASSCRKEPYLEIGSRINPLSIKSTNIIRTRKFLP